MRLLLTILILAVVACGSKEPSGPAVEPGAPAGDVREVTGAVTAKRGDAAARPLAVGDVVAGDDTIETAAGASVVIELRHNGARWSLAGGRSAAVASSAAWSAPRREGGGTTDERTTAAGRHAEREAADTAASAEPPAAAPEVAAAPVAEGEREAATPEPVAATPAPPPAEPDERAPARRTRTGAKREVATTGGGAADALADTGAAPPPPPPTPPPTKGDKAAPRGIWSGALVGEVKVQGALDGMAAKRTLGALKGKLGDCWNRSKPKGPSSGALTATLTVGADGKVTTIAIDADDVAKAASACVQGLLRGVAFPPEDAGSTVSATIRFTSD